MNDLLKWIATYSPSVAALLVLSAGVVFVFKIVVERAIDARFAEQTKALELRLQRRSAFEERVLLDRYQLVTQFSNRLEDVRHNITRIRSGSPPAKDFQVGQDIPSLTAIHGELKVNRSILSDELFDILRRKEELAWEAANGAEGVPSNDGRNLMPSSATQWNEFSSYPRFGRTDGRQARVTCSLGERIAALTPPSSRQPLAGLRLMSSVIPTGRTRALSGGDSYV